MIRSHLPPPPLPSFTETEMDRQWWRYNYEFPKMFFILADINLDDGTELENFQQLIQHKNCRPPIKKEIHIRKHASDCRLLFSFRNFVKIGTTVNELYFVSLKLLRFAKANIGS